ncbi:hypothetical protein KSP39_PZI009188 [Platanthera zijinensis]|uniref:Uncharacterized protein n=1 Tax=Platanthera zijinensis TaxID=2320716 RepID=A0AAP0BKZ6_9ASPA
MESRITDLEDLLELELELDRVQQLPALLICFMICRNIKKFFRRQARLVKGSLSELLAILLTIGEVLCPWLFPTIFVLFVIVWFRLFLMIADKLPSNEGCCPCNYPSEH